MKMKMRLCLLCPCALLLMTIVAHAEGPRAVQAIHEPLVIRESPANEAKLIRLPDDSLRIYFIHRPEGRELRSISSTDGGVTWSDEKTEFPLPGEAYYAVQAVVDDQGEVQLAFHIREQGERGYRGRHYNLWHTKTLDGRSRWTEPKQFFDGYVGSMRGMIQTRGGRLLLPVAIAVPEREQPPGDGSVDYGWNDTVTFYSHDRGDSWTLGPTRLQIQQDNTRGVTRYGGVEPNIIELVDGRVWMLIRTKNGHLWESFSGDGIEWTEPKPSKLISSDSPASLARMGDGKIVMLLNACQKWDDPKSYAIGGREVLHAAISSDEGKTWQGMREILRDGHGAGKGDRGTAYGEVLETADGKLLVVSGQGEGRRAIIMLDPKWLLETQASDDFAHGDRDWTMYDAAGAEVAAHPDDPQRRALHIRRTDADAPAAAVWNFPAGAGGELKLRIRMSEAAAPAIIALTDHFSVAGDTRAHEHAVYRLDLDHAALPRGMWHDITIAWQPNAVAIVKINGAEHSRLQPLRQTDLHISYLRLMSRSDAIDENGFTVERVDVKIDPPAAQLARM
jgi:hypothetical protein